MFICFVVERAFIEACQKQLNTYHLSMELHAVMMILLILHRPLIL